MAARRIGEQDVASWIRIHADRDGAVLLARHVTPLTERVGEAVTALTIMGVICLWLYNLFSSPPPIAFSNPVVGIAVVVATVVAPAILKQLFFRSAILFANTTRVTFSPKGIRWTKGIRRFQAPPSVPHAFVVETHERAEREGLEERKSGRWQRRVFRDSRQVVLRFGHEKGQRMVVADIARDPIGKKADELRAGLAYADEAWRTLSATGPVPGNPSGGTSQTDPMGQL